MEISSPTREQLKTMSGIIMERYDNRVTDLFKIKTRYMCPKDNQVLVDHPNEVPVLNEEGIDNDANTAGLPGEDNDAEKTIRETPKMRGL
jgi:hypothetical protein